MNTHHHIRIGHLFLFGSAFTASFSDHRLGAGLSIDHDQQQVFIDRTAPSQLRSRGLASAILHHANTSVDPAAELNAVCIELLIISRDEPELAAWLGLPNISSNAAETAAQPTHA